MNTRNAREPRSGDPDPITILTLCFAGVSMVAAVSNTLVNIFESRRKRREEYRVAREAYAEVLVSADRLRRLGSGVTAAIQDLRRDAKIALGFLDPRRKASDLKFAIGANAIHVSESQKEMWNMLVDNVANNIKTVNRLVVDYTTEVSAFMDETIKFEATYEFPFESELIHYIYSRQSSLSQNIARFQALSQKSALSRAEIIFEAVCEDAEQLVREFDRIIITRLPRRLPDAR